MIYEFEPAWTAYNLNIKGQLSHPKFNFKLEVGGNLNFTAICDDEWWEIDPGRSDLHIYLERGSECRLVEAIEYRIMEQWALYVRANVVEVKHLETRATLLTFLKEVK